MASINKAQLDAEKASIESFLKSVEDNELAGYHHDTLGEEFVYRQNRGEGFSFAGNPMTVEILDSYFGEENGATETYVVFKVSELSDYAWRFTGRYDSWDFGEWYFDYVYAVTPREVTVTVWDVLR